MGRGGGAGVVHPKVYSGGADFSTWVRKFYRHAQANGWSEGIAKWKLGAYLDGMPGELYSAWMEMGEVGVSSLGTILTTLMEECSSADEERRAARHELKRRKQRQGESVHDFAASFRLLSIKAEEDSERTMVERFCNALTPRLAREVKSRGGEEGSFASARKLAANLADYNAEYEWAMEEVGLPFSSKLGLAQQDPVAVRSVAFSQHRGTPLGINLVGSETHEAMALKAEKEASAAKRESQKKDGLIAALESQLSQALAGQSGRLPGGDRPRGKPPVYRNAVYDAEGKRRCWRCKQEGHEQRDCPQPRPRPPAPRNSAPVPAPPGAVVNLVGTTVPTFAEVAAAEEVIWASSAAGQVEREQEESGSEPEMEE